MMADYLPTMFEEGADPLDQPQGQSSGAPAPAASAPLMPQPMGPEEPTFSQAIAPAPPITETISAAFREYNPLSSAISAMLRANPESSAVDPAFNPIDYLRRTAPDLEQNYANSFLGLPNQGTADDMIASIRQHESDTDTLGQSGLAGKVVATAIGMTDPIFAIPVLGEATKAASIFKTAARFAAAGAIQTTLDQAALNTLHGDSHFGDNSIVNISTNALLMGVLGGAYRLMTPAERAAAEETVAAGRPVNPKPVLDQSGEVVRDPYGNYVVTSNEPPPAAKPANENFSVIGRPEESLPDGLSFKSEPAKELSEPGDVHEVQIVNENGEPQYRGQLTKEGGPTWAVSSIDNASKQHADLEVPLLRAMAQYAEERSGTLIDRGVSDAPVREQLVSQGFGTPMPDGSLQIESGVDAGVAKQPSVDLPLSPDERLALPQSAVGAQVSDTRQLRGKSFGLEKIPVVGPGLTKISPNLRAAFRSKSVAHRRAMGELVESAIQNEGGEQRARGGPVLESERRVELNRAQLKVRQILQDNWVAHYHGADNRPNAVSLQAQKQGIGAGTRGGKLSYADFDAEVGRAMSNGDTHPVPEVQQAARELRPLLDQWVKRGQQVLGPDGRPMFAEAMEPPKGDKSFFPRLPLRDGMIRLYNETRDAFTNWLLGEQSANAATRDRIVGLNEKLGILSDQAKRLDARLATIQGRQGETETRLSERAMEARQAEPRAENLQARADTIRDSISELEEFIGTMREDAGPEARGRLADLEAEVAALRKQAAPMSAAELARIEKEEVGSTLTGNARKGAEVFLGKRKAPTEPNFLAWMARRGVTDTGGDVRAILGSNTAVPGLIRVARSSAAPRAPSVDDWGEILQNEFPGAFPNGRPDEREVLDIIEGAARGRAPSWFSEAHGGNDVREINQTADELHALFDELGQKPTTMREVAEALNGLNGQEPRALARLRERVEAASQVPPAEEAVAARRQEVSQIRQIVGQAIKDRGKHEAALSREGARAGEAAITANRAKGRISLLAEQLDRQSTVRTLLETARENAESERNALRAQLENEVKNWRGATADEARAALKTRGGQEAERQEKIETGEYQGKNGRLTGADTAIDNAVKAILKADTDKSPQEIMELAQDILDRYIGSPDGRIPYDIASGGPDIGYTGGMKQQVRGSLNRRAFAMPSAEFPIGTLNTSAEHVLAAHFRTMIPDILLTERFGDVDMTNEFHRIDEDYRRLVKPDTPQAERKALFNQRDSDITDLAAARDRFRNVYGWDPSPFARKQAGIVRDFQNVAGMSSLGTSVFNRFNDLTNVLYRYAFSTVFKDSYAAFFKYVSDPEFRGVVRAQAHDAGVGCDGILGFVMHNLYDLHSNVLPGNKFSRSLSTATNATMWVNLHAPWTDVTKQLVANVVQGELGRVGMRFLKGTQTKTDVAYIADANIAPEVASKIGELYEAHHIEVRGSKFANVDAWEGPGAEQAKAAFRAAISREANINVLTAGIGDKPLLMSRPIWGLILQFHQFVAAATEKIAISNLQRRDARALQGLICAVPMGMVSYRLWTWASGEEASDNPMDWIKEGVERSAMTGWLSDINQITSKLSTGVLDYNRLFGATPSDSRHRDLSLGSVVGGPTYSAAEGLVGAAMHAAEGRYSAADNHQIRLRMMLQNEMFFRRLVDQVEDSVDGAMGFQRGAHGQPLQ